MPQIKDLAFWNKKCQVIPSPKNLHFFFNTWDKLNRRKEKEQSCCLRKTVPMESANKRVDSSEGHKGYIIYLQSNCLCSTLLSKLFWLPSLNICWKMTCILVERVVILWTSTAWGWVVQQSFFIIPKAAVESDSQIMWVKPIVS